MCLYPFLRAYSTACSTAPGGDFQVPGAKSEQVAVYLKKICSPRPTVGIEAPVLSLIDVEAGIL